MGRYLNRRYIAVSWDEAVRLAGLDQTPIEEIRYSADAELIHRTDSTILDYVINFYLTVAEM